MWEVLLVLFSLVGMLGNTATGAEEVHSLHPLLLEKDALLVPQIMGTWQTDFSGLTLTFSPAGDNFYRLVYVELNAQSTFEATFIQIGHNLILDLVPVFSDTNETPFVTDHWIASHSFYLVRLANDTIFVSGFNYRWFHAGIKNKSISLPFSWYNKMLLLTATTSELQEFLLVHGNDQALFGDPLLIYRQKTEPMITKPSINDEHQTEVFAIDTSAAIKPICLPSFPYIDGWLGGDGDISLPIDSSQSLWIFGDTFVGEKNQKVRAGAKMVSNTIAITTCQSDRQSAIEYFWRNPYTNNPEPFFKSFTNRYKYWPCAAFMVRKNLYVPLLKIGPSLGASPDDIFNFKGVGMSLAKVSDPNSTTPDQCDIQLFPWSHFLDPDAWGCTAVDGDYLYLFTKGKNQTVLLLRIPFEYVESPENRTEYYGIDGEWKTALPPEDMKVLFNGDAGNSVSYYRDLKQWMMVCGPGFLTNKIRVRTAPALVGPWSEEKLIYECPEQTPGSKTYDPDNFCYMGRDHSEFYNRETGELLITYDCNGRKAAERMDIYSARVIKVSIKELLDKK